MKNNHYFKKALLSMGIADTRVDSLADASDKLHSALSSLDERNPTHCIFQIYFIIYIQWVFLCLLSCTK